MNTTAHELDAVFRDILDGLSAAGRTRTARAVGQALRQSQQARIRAQKNADGSPYPARKRQVMHTRREVKFLWNGEVRTLRQWGHKRYRKGRAIIGRDPDRGGALRTFYRDDIERYIAVSSMSARQTSKKNTPMFARLRTYRWLKMRSDAEGAVVGFDGLAARIARVHQAGLRDEVAPGVMTTYPVRELLGVTAADERRMRDTIIRSLGSAAR
ncbi:TPA: phage virion morphogenesis protein [Escherichia coli]|uniref:phage virion morphogenesis protein n=1 Tax=Escherichia marmotae TaxID=1499973 RepID=UPI001B95744C|nr:phage virion morphogenesis protein [Escherichia coli]HBC8836314.1 phage virion morphogenesis protein [Escherichia coli]